MSGVGFGWKRKACELKGGPATAEKAFKPEEQSEEVEDPDFDWVALTKKKKVDALEDGKARFERLKVEGSCLAEEGRFWEALGRWQAALELEPNNARVWEMRAQALVALHEWEGAVEAAEKATAFENTWWVGYQTLGRAHLGLGHLEAARTCFQKALHLNPEEGELWTEDLAWVQALIAHQLKEKEDGEEVEREEGENGVLVKKRVTAEELLDCSKSSTPASSKERGTQSPESNC